MTFLAQALIQGAVGFAVGAGTNDLAIRWIFRTIYRKKLVLGKAIQDVISTELMSPDLVDYPSPNDLANGNPVAENALADGVERLSARLADDFVRYYTQQDARVLFVRNVFGKIRGVLGPLMPDLLGLVVRMPELHARVQAEIARVLRGFTAHPIGRVNRIVDPSVRVYLASICADAFAGYLAKNLPVLLRQLKIWDVIQDTIAGFDMQRIECVTRRVINAELRGVTLWGGVIGLIVGISQSIVLWLLK